MCGRYARFSPVEETARRLGADTWPDAAPRYNIAPSQPVLAARMVAPGSIEVTPMGWGLIPSWARAPDKGPRLINARVETVNAKPAFRGAFRARRCLILADGFYEWRATASGRQPYFVRPDPPESLLFAGLWEPGSARDGERATCTILTMPAAPALLPLHHRMPVLVTAPDWRSWLSPGAIGDAQCAALLERVASVPLRFDPVTPQVNDPRWDRPECVQIRSSV